MAIDPLISYYYSQIEPGPRLIPGELIRLMISALGDGPVTSINIVSANGISGSAPLTLGTANITLALGAITPSSVAASGTVTGSNLSGTNTGDQTIILTGDVTGAGTGSFATTIASGAVSLSKMANMATASFLGRNTASTGSPEVLSIATVKTMLNLTGTNSGDVTLSGENYLSLAGQVITANAVNLSGTNATGTLAAGRFPALTGDVTTSAGALATTIAANAVSNAKLATVADLTLKSNISGGVLEPADNTLTAIIDAAITNVQGSILYRNGTIWTSLAPGASGNVLQTQGAGANPQWGSAAAGTVTSVSGTADRITVATGTTTPVIDIAATYVGQTSITTLGTIATGVWSGTAIAANKGGTGIANNASSTITISGAFGTTLTVTGITAVTLPTSGTLTTLATVVGTANTFTKAQSNAPVAVTSSSNSIATDASLSNIFTHTMTEDTTLANPSNLVSGTYYTWVFTQHASAAKTLALGNLFVPLGTAFTITTTLSAKAALTALYDGTSLLYTYAQA